MKNTYIVLCYMLLLSCNEPSNFEQNINEVIAIEDVFVDLEKVIPSNSIAKTTVTIEKDAFFSTAKTYQAISLNTIIQQYLLPYIKDTTDALLVFECVDGYKPTLPLSKALRNDGYIALKDEDAPADKNWLDSVVAKFEPYYLVWAGDEKSLTWPYGLSKIRVETFEQQYAAALPPKDLEEGFKLFKTNCMKCHSINMVGGNLGPELNHPKNITEYWKKEDIKAFIRQPQAYRYNSKMPPQPQISEQQFNAIYAYLKGMKTQKL